MAPRTGRPTDNPKPHKITARVDQATKDVLDDYTAQKGVSEAEALRRGIHKLKEELDVQQ